MATAFLSGAPYVSSPAYAELGFDIERKSSERPWVEQVRSGVADVGSTIDAHVEQEDGEAVIKEEYHPFSVPSGYEHWKGWKVSIFDEIEKDGDKRQSELHYFRNKNDHPELFVVIKLGDSIAAYFHADRDTQTYGSGRASYDPDENFEQKKNTEKPQFHFERELYFPWFFD